MAHGWLLLALPLGLAAAAPAGAQTCYLMAPTITGAGKITGTPGNDVILGSDFAHDVIDGGGGYDRICSGGGDDRIRATGAALIDAGEGDDRISVTNSGSALDTEVRGWSGDDTIKFINHAAGENSILGDAGRDVIKVRTSAGETHADGGPDEDTIKFFGAGGTNVAQGGGGIDACKLKGSVTPADCEGP